MRLTPVSKAPMEALLSSLNLGVQQGLDPDPENIVAVGTFAYGPLQSPQQVSRTTLSWQFPSGSFQNSISGASAFPCSTGKLSHRRALTDGLVVAPPVANRHSLLGCFQC